MKKAHRILLIILISIISLLIIGFFVVKANADKILCAFADRYFNNKEYDKAYTLYDSIHMYKPENKTYTYKMVQCLMKMPYTYSVQKKLLEFAQKDDGSDAEKLATKAILFLRKKINGKFGNTYIKDALSNGLVIRWSKKKLPLKYYIEKISSVPDYYFTETEGAFKDWERETDEYITFKKVSNDVSADITVKFRPTTNGASSLSHGTYNAARTTPVIENDSYLKQMNITGIFRTHTGEFFTPKEIKTIMSHEIGHALGIWGHPEDNESIMFYSMNNPYDYYEKRIDTSLSKKDTNTVKLLYALAPDITNNPSELTEKEIFICPQALLEDLNNNTENMIKTALAVLEKDPNNIGYALSLADAYNSSGKYKESIKLMESIADKISNINLLNILYYNIANCYINLKDFNNAKLYALQALNISNSPENRCLCAYIEFCKGNYDKAEEEFLKIRAEKPDFVPASLGLADIYIKKKKYSHARKCLKELLQYNPQALDDSSLHQYKLLTVF